MTLRAHLFAASLLGTTLAMALACSSSAPTNTSSDGERVESTAEAVTGDELSVYAAACDSIMGSAATVPAFDCDTGIDIPVTYNHAAYDPSVDYMCDAPDQFQSDCVQHEKLVPIASTGTATTVAICRRFTNNTTANYDEVEVIQHDKSNGDTCFYSSAFVALHSVPGKAPSPSAGVGRPGGIPYWETPTQYLREQWGVHLVCHDNGAFLRSPFVKQLTPVLSSAFVHDLGFGNDAYNLSQPYHPLRGCLRGLEEGQVHSQRRRPVHRLPPHGHEHRGPRHGGDVLAHLGGLLHGPAAPGHQPGGAREVLRWLRRRRLRAHGRGPPGPALDDPPGQVRVAIGPVVHARVHGLRAQVFGVAPRHGARASRCRPTAACSRSEAHRWRKSATAAVRHEWTVAGRIISSTPSSS